MGPWPTQGDESRLLFSNYCPGERRPPLCHLDRSAAQWRDLRSAALSWKCFSTEHDMRHQVHFTFPHKMIGLPTLKPVNQGVIPL
jgi:hypothetical protein